MILLNVFLSIKPDQENNFIDFTKDLIKKSRAESGNSLYNLYKQTDAECKYAIVEHWADDEAVNLHNSTDHFQNFVAEIAKFISEPLDLQKYNV